MRPTATLMRLALCLSSAAPLVSAWPGWLPDLDALVVRADKGSEENTANPTSPTNPPNEEGNTAKPTQPSQSGKKGGSTKTDDSSSKKTTATKSKTTHHTMFDAEAPPGNVVMQTPNVFAGSGLYKIGDYVTWGWNYTNILGTPTAIDVLISCSTVSETWTLTSNMTFKTSASYVWDSSVQATDVVQPLPVAMYTLIIKDSDAAISTIPDPGYLGTFSSFTFGLYTPQPYVPFPEWHCDACNAALSKFDHHVLGFAITMGLVTVLSFTWFVSGLDLN
ncbi:uncharacterized protein Triagg1_9062 [Trichoderma aggressivum f. europaeum]|uniref:DUF7137 domain-containing protein n=1 Tax=Trichoderma aggressivum f. europaeum TaxID=173218 RepID=A0AAE1I989_9HYPO|nr:hypothetical protein Triagg1_9062 [Trichoderma aggressivum f. europaeum]